MDPIHIPAVQGQFVTLEDLRESVALTNVQINDLVHNHQKFVGTIRKLNNEAKARIVNEKPREGLVYLMEAQKILEYGAGCGKNIDRNMIVCVLHNEACCYQKLWELEKCSNYIEALIFNVSSFLKTNTPSPRDAEDYIKTSASLTSHLRERLYGKSFSHRSQLFKYHLQFCAINSQLRNHKGALVSGRRAIGIMKDMLQELYSLSIQRNSMQNNYGSTSILPEEQPAEIQIKNKILAGVTAVVDEPDIKKIAEYQATARHYFRKWGVRKQQQTNQTVKQSLKNFSIGTIMQMKPMGFQESRESTMDPEHVMETVYEQKHQGDMLKIFTLPKVLHNVLLLTMGYFTIATQLRLIANQKYKQSEQKKKKSQEFCQSQIYHLIAIIITCIYVPYDMLYMRHLLTSFSNHYTCNITGDKSTHSINDDQAKVMINQFDSICMGTKASKDNNAGKKLSMTINRSLALQFADSIRIGNDFGVGLREDPPNSKESRLKDVLSPKQTKKTRKAMPENLEIPHSARNNNSKSRAHSQAINRNSGGFSGQLKEKQLKHANKNTQQSGQIKKKSKSLQQKVRKSHSNNSKTGTKKKKTQRAENKQKKSEYYKKSKNSGLYRQGLEQTSKGKLRKTNATNGGASIQKSSKKLSIYGSKGMSGHNSIGIGKDKKGTPLKKNLDKYYF